jgi:signal transduction histidine kinase
MKLNHMSLSLRFALGLLAVAVFALAAFYLIMHPPMSDLGLMAVFLGATAALSGLAGFAAYRLGWLEQTPSLRLALLGGYALASLLTFINVWFAARQMFASQHDLQLATILLIFAAGIAMLLGYFLSITITRRIQILKDTAHTLAIGDLSARAALAGKDEIASLAASFNEMAERLQEADRQQQKLDTLRRDLVAWASHDLQTPLTAIRVQLEALADGVVDDPETAQRYLRTTQRQVNDLSTLIDDLFQVAQLDAGGMPILPTNCSLSDLISDTLESFSALAVEQGVTLSGSASPEIDPAMLDAQRIGRALNNLIGNALRHTPPGGAVFVKAERQGNDIHLSVSDTGEGIDPSDLPHIFERFYRGERSRNRDRGGSGLGLAIARGLIQAHGGEIWAESQPGAGTTFYIRLPG